ncbi:hypothetical protein KAR48_12510 [bacterium]|nr:hypothetical protein [bacterium]
MLNKTFFRGLLSGKILFTFLLLAAASQSFAQLSGTYSVGSGQTYATLTAAVADLNSNGVSGAVVFELTDASYTTSETFPITINEITGASSTNTITIKPASGVTTEISGDSGGDNTSIIKLYGADYIIIDGSNNGTSSRDLTITNTKTGAWSATIWLASLGDDQGCQNNVIKNCLLSYGIKGYTAAVISFSASSHILNDGGYDNNDNTIENNEIYKCTYGIKLRGPSAEKNSGNIIRNNLIGSNNSSDYIDSRGIHCIYQNSIEISGNEIFNLIFHNDIYGLNIDRCTAVTISKNKIHDIIDTSIDPIMRGIYIYSNVSDPDITISNNMIWHVAGQGSSGPDDFPTGIFIDGSSVTTGIRLYFNSIYLTADANYGLDYHNTYSASLLIDGNTTGIDCRNNIFRNSLGEKTGSSYPTSCYAVYVKTSSNPFAVCDNNIYYVNSTSDNDYIGGKFETNYSTLSAWQGFTGDDDNSFNEDPNFISESKLSLSDQNSDAITISGYPMDIYGNTRHTTPDVGAFEYYGTEITTSDISNIAHEGASSGGNITNNDGAAITARGVCWSTSIYPTTADSKTTDGSGDGTFTSSITGLASSTTYYVRAYATNAYGTSYGDNKQFTTTDGLPEVTTSSITQISYNSATGGGENLSDGGPTITAKGVCWSTSQNPTTSDSFTNDGTGTDNFTSSITGLNASTTYYVRTYATNSTGTSYGANVEFTTTDGLPEVTTSSITQITHNSASGGGTVTNDETLNVTARGVCWSTSTDPTTSNSHTTDGAGEGSFTSSLSGLQSSTTYYVRAYATNANGTKYGDNKQFTTTDGLPDITTSSITQITDSTATGGGENLNDDGHAITAKGVCWSTSQNPTTSDLHTNDGTGTDNYTSSITGLNSSTTYYVRAYATNSQGTSYGDNVEFITIEYVTTSSITQISDSSATGGGENLNDNGNSITAKGVCWSTSQNPTTSDSHTNDGTGTDDYASSITGLNPSTTYYVRAYITNSVKTNYGANVEFTTAKNPPGNVLEFDGNDYIETTLNDLSGSEITIEYWFKGSSTQSAVRQQNGPYVVAGWNDKHILSNDGGTAGIAVGSGAEDGSWHHIVMCWKQNTVNGFKSYLDGNLIEERTSSNTPLPNIDANVFLASQNGSSEYMTGSLEEVRIWNDVRTESELRENMHLPLNGDEQGLVAYYRFDHISGALLSDLSSNGNDGTLHDMTNEDWVASTVSLGEGTSTTQTVSSTGSVAFTDTDIEMDFTAKSGSDDFVITKINNVPNTNPIGEDDVMDGQYWVIDQFGSSTFTADLHITTSEDLTSDDRDNPNRIRCFTRSSNSDGAWSLLKGAYTVSASSNTAVFKDISTLSQYIITRNLDVDNSNGPGNALEFDGTDQYANLGNSETLKPTTELTVELWAYCADWSNFQNARFISNLESNGYGIGADSGDLFGVVRLNGNYVSAAVDHTGFSSGWHHFVLTCDGQYVKLFVDGVLEDTGNAGTEYSIQYDSDNSTLLGADVDGSSNPTSHYFNGKLDEVSIWSIARTEQQIRENINRTLNGDESGLAAYYKLNETTGYFISNQSSGNNGTTVNMGNDAWVESTTPIGAGSSSTQTAFTTGTATLGNLSVATTDAFDNAVDLFCAEIENSPNTTSGTTDNVLDKYFVLYAFGTPGTFSTDLTFTLEEGFISAADQAAPSNLKLYKRTSTADGDWALETSGTEATSTTVKFEGITSYSQFIIGKEEGVRIQTKIFLEGPYDSETNEMYTSLTVPTTSPYSEDARTVSSIPADIVDWVLVELRSTVDGSAVVSKSAFLHKDGRIVADDGTTSYIEMEASADDYFIVIKHRNHLAVESDEVHTLSTGSSTPYDFTVDASTAYDKYYGGDAAILETGIYGMYGGDSNQSGIVTNSDKDGIIANLNEAGYYDADTNCSGIVTNSDKDAIIANLNKATSVN